MSSVSNFNGIGRIKRPASEAGMASMWPDEFVSGLIGDNASFELDPDSYKTTWPLNRSGWLYMLGEAEVGDETYPTSVTIYFPLKVERAIAALRHREASARIDLRLGNPIAAPDEQIRYPAPPIQGLG
jgi:hypothetical protein